MKASILKAISCAATLQIAGAQADITPFGYKNYVSQTQLPANGVEAYAGVVVSSGTTLGLPVKETGGVLYKLYTVKNSLTGVVSYPLAETTVGLFVPRAPIVITSDDPYNAPVAPGFAYQGSRRTRADMPYTITVTPSGLDSSTSKPDCFKKVNFTRTSQSHGAKRVDLVPNTNPLIPDTFTTLSENKSFVYRRLHNLPPVEDERLRRGACGREEISSYSLPDTQIVGQEIAAVQLDSKAVEIWPITRGVVAPYPGQGSVFRGPVPDIMFTAIDIYPRATVTLRYYEGPYVAGKIGKQIYITTNTQRYSQDLPAPAKDLTPLFNRDGEWTLVMETQTPESFNDERYVTRTRVIIDRSINVNTTLTTTE